MLITHMHPDHINGVLTPAGEALFPNAELVVTATDYAFWHDDANMNQAPDEAKPFFIRARKPAAAYADRLPQVDGERDALGSIHTVPLPGHTPGHAGFIVESDGEALMSCTWRPISSPARSGASRSMSIPNWPPRRASGRSTGSLPIGCRSPGCICRSPVSDMSGATASPSLRAGRMGL
ncbi:MBL fold metallo-hydrolase [Mesorhizobium sp. M0663]|uniref:MBL fold metallo-hydrolase n=1 Tax=unclassified Mesorhizobium TaxID=325217 RepID=UPI00333525E0